MPACKGKATCIQDGSAGTPICLHLFEVLIIIKSFQRMEMDLVILMEVSRHSCNKVNPELQCLSSHTNLKLTLSYKNAAPSLRDQDFVGK